MTGYLTLSECCPLLGLSALREADQDAAADLLRTYGVRTRQVAGKRRGTTYTVYEEAGVRDVRRRLDEGRAAAEAALKAGLAGKGGR